MAARLRGGTCTCLLFLAFGQLVSTGDAVPPMSPKTPRIIGGREAEPGRLPYFADLTVAGVFPVCGGVLIAPDMILTAAHCSLQYSSVAVNRHDKFNPGPQTEQYRPEQEFIHPLNVQDYSNDIMVVKLAETVTQTDYVQINNNSAVPEVGANVTVAGWGDRDPNVTAVDIPKTLHQVSVEVISNEQCAKSKGYLDTYEFFIEDSMICAAERGIGACQGDSGGGLVQLGDTAEEDLVLGIVSWGFTCASPLYPAVYVRVSSHYEWIRSVVCTESAYPPDYMECGSNAVSFPPTPAPMEEPDIENPIYFEFVFSTDAFAPFDTSMRLEHIVDYQTIELVNGFVNETFGPDSVFTRGLVLEEGELYAFVLLDYSENGLESGGLVLGMEDENGNTAFFDQVGEDYGKGFVSVFRASREFPQFYFQDRTFQGNAVLELFLAFDGFPEEIGVELTFSNGTTLFQRPPRHFWNLPNSTTIFRISVPTASHEYVLSVTDVAGDGFAVGSRAGYILYEVESGEELVASSFPNGYAERTTFVYPRASLSPTSSPTDTTSLTATPSLYSNRTISPTTSQPDAFSDSPTATPEEIPEASIASEVPTPSDAIPLDELATEYDTSASPTSWRELHSRLWLSSVPLLSILSLLGFL